MLKDKLNSVYHPLEDKQTQICKGLAALPFRLRTGWFNGHYYRNAQGEWERSSFPIPEVDVLDLCDVEIHFEHICITTKLTRTKALEYSYEKLTPYTFEVYGVKDYLLDFFREGTAVAKLKQNIRASREEEIGFSFSMPFDSDTDQIVSLILLLRDEGFYY